MKLEAIVGELRGRVSVLDKAGQVVARVSTNADTLGSGFRVRGAGFCAGC